MNFLILSFSTGMRFPHSIEARDRSHINLKRYKYGGYPHNYHMYGSNYFKRSNIDPGM